MSRHSSNQRSWVEAEKLSATLGELLGVGEPLVVASGERPDSASLKGKAVLVQGVDLPFETDLLKEWVGAAEVLILTVPLPELESGSGPGFTEASGQLADAGLPVSWEGLTFSNPDLHERHAALFVLSDGHQDRLTSLMETGLANLALHGGDTEPSSRPAHVCIATNEIFGPTKNGGIGTACTSLAHALAEAGDKVTILFLGDRRDLANREVNLADWEYHYKEVGIQFVPLVPHHHPVLDWEYANIRTAHAAFHWLSEAHEKVPFDVIHFAECNGHGYYTTLAKRLGLAFADCLVSLTTHSSTEWIFESNHVPFDSYYNLSTDHLERRSVEDCDLLIGPSLYLHEWMRGHNWKLPKETQQQQYVQPHAARGKGEIPSEPQPVREIVFFGRLETRKGLVTFCDALDRMAGNPDAEGVTVTFLGKEATVEGEHALKYLERRSQKWGRPYQTIDNLQQDEAVAYLQGEGRLALMPSVVDNSPNTVMECIGLRVPFVAARTGGIPELIHPGDVAASTFYHPEVSERGGPLADRLLTACRDGQRPARPAVDPDTNEPAWARWHRQIAARNDAHRAETPSEVTGSEVCVCLGIQKEDAPEQVRATIQAIAAQEVTPAEILVAGAPLPDGIDLPNLRHLGEVAPSSEADLWNAVAKEAAQPLLLMVAIGAELLPSALHTLARGADHGGFGALTAFRDSRVPPFNEGEKRYPDFASIPEGTPGTISEGLHAEYPISGHPASNLLKASAGEQVLLVSRSAYQESTGFRSRPDGLLDLTDFLCGLSITGVATTAVPVPLWKGRPRPQPEPGSSGAYALGQSLLARCDNLVDPALRHLPAFARAQSDRARQMIDHMDWLRSELTAHQELMAEREEFRVSEKADLKDEIKALKKQAKDLDRKAKKLEEESQRGWFSRKKR